MQFSNIIGLPVYSIYECEMIGYVLSIDHNQNLSKITNLVVADDENEINYTLSARNIYSLNTDSIFIKNKTKLSVNINENNNVINNIILDINGKIDRVKDITIDDKYNITSIDGSNMSITPSEIIYHKNNILLINTGNSNIKRKTFYPRIKKIKNITQATTTPVNILDNITKPTVVRVNNINNIIGKTLINNLYSRQNEILATKNSIVTYNTINIARQFNVLDNLSKLVK